MSEYMVSARAHVCSPPADCIRYTWRFTREDVGTVWLCADCEQWWRAKNYEAQFRIWVRCSKRKAQKLLANGMKQTIAKGSMPKSQPRPPSNPLEYFPTRGQVMAKNPPPPPVPVSRLPAMPPPPHGPTREWKSSL